MLTHNYQQGSETSQKQNYKYIYMEHYHFQTALSEKKSVYVQVYVNMNDIFCVNTKILMNSPSFQRGKNKVRVLCIILPEPVDAKDTWFLAMDSNY